MAGFAAVIDPHSGNIEAIVEDSDGNAVLFDSEDQFRWVAEHKLGMLKAFADQYDFLPVVPLWRGHKSAYGQAKRREEKTK